MKTRPNRATPARASAPSASQSARDLAYRRWRLQSTAATAPARDPSAQFLAHHRWGTTPVSEAIAPAAPPWSDTSENVVILAVLAGVAAAIYAGRKNGVQRERSSAESEGNWRTCLIGGSVVAAAALLLLSEDARSKWGLILGLEGLLLAAVWPAGVEGQQAHSDW